MSIEAAKQAVGVLFDEKEPDFRFPPDLIWDYAQDPQSLPNPRSRQHLIPRLVKLGYLIKTEKPTKAWSKSRKGGTTYEYAFGPVLTGAVASEEQGVPHVPPAPEAAEAEPPTGPTHSSYLMAAPAAGGQPKLSFPLQRIVHGAPGSGKSYRLEEDAKQAHHVIRTVFHPESRYSDFVGGLRPESIYKVGPASGRFVGSVAQIPGEPYVQYVLQPGPLLKAYHLACEYPDRSVVLIIEELSRANAAHVFGDTLQLLDRVEDQANPLHEYSTYEIEPRSDVRSWLTLNDIAHDQALIGSLRFPPNLYIWATMNRSDQNARQLDSAFLRRWSKQYISYDDVGAYDDQPVPYGGAALEWGALRKAINDKLSRLQGIPEDKLVGPYFLPRSRLDSPDAVYEDLFGYIWNDVLKTRAGDFFGGVSTFAELRRQWNDGNGTPLGPIGGPSSALGSDV